MMLSWLCRYPTKPVGGNKQGITGHIRIPPPNYVCFRCGQRGHWLRFCPTQGVRVSEYGVLVAMGTIRMQDTIVV